MSANHVFRRSRHHQHAEARTSRQKIKVSPTYVRLISLAVIFGLLIAAVVVFKPRPSVPSIQTIECTIQGELECPESALQVLQPLYGKPLLFGSLHHDITLLVQPAGYTLQSVTRVVPSSLVVRLKPLDILFSITYQEQTMSITSNGAVLMTSNLQNQSQIQLHSTDAKTQSQLITVATAPAWLVETVTSVKSFLTEQHQQATSIELHSPFELLLVLEGESHPILINPQESALNLARLSSILKSDQHSFAASPSAVLDVRFRLPVLRS